MNDILRKMDEILPTSGLSKQRDHITFLDNSASVTRRLVYYYRIMLTVMDVATSIRHQWTMRTQQNQSHFAPRIIAQDTPRKIHVFRMSCTSTSTSPPDMIIQYDYSAGTDTNTSIHGNDEFPINTNDAAILQ